MLRAISFGRLLAFGAFDQRDHPVDEGRAGRGADAHPDPVRQNLRAAGDGRAVTAGFADDRSGFAGDRRFVDGGDTFDDFAVRRNDITGLDEHDVTDLEAGAGNHLVALRSSPVSSFACVSVRVLRSESACALPRPSATASAKLANSTVNHSQMFSCSEKPRPSPP